MAYITQEQKKVIAANIKAKYPTKEGWKFSITIQHHSALNIAIMEAPVRFIDNDENYQLNHYHLDGYKNSEILEDITKIAMTGNYDNSDSMTDYFDVGYYFHLSAGKWDRPFVLKAPKLTADEIYTKRQAFFAKMDAAQEVLKKATADYNEFHEVYA